MILTLAFVILWFFPCTDLSINKICVVFILDFLPCSHDKNDLWKSSICEIIDIPRRIIKIISKNIYVKYKTFQICSQKRPKRGSSGIMKVISHESYHIKFWKNLINRFCEFFIVFHFLSHLSHFKEEYMYFP